MILPCLFQAGAGKTLMSAESQHSVSAQVSPLRWQSRLLGLLVVPLCAVWLLLYSDQFWTPSTREGLAICLGFGFLVWGLKAATPAASMTGFLLTACMYLITATQPEGSWTHTALLPGLTLFVCAFLATRFRRAAKERLGTAEPRSGRQTSQIVANLGVAAVIGILLLSHPLQGVVGMVAALAEATADTISSELGQVLGGTPRMITNWRPVPAGTDGGVSAAGTAVGIFSALLVVLVAMPTLRLDMHSALIAWSGGIFGLFVDSLLGATLERKGWLNNDAVNFLSTLAAALAAAEAANR